MVVDDVYIIKMPMRRTADLVERFHKFRPKALSQQCFRPFLLYRKLHKGSGAKAAKKSKVFRMTGARSARFFFVPMRSARFFAQSPCSP